MSINHQWRSMPARAWLRGGSELNRRDDSGGAAKRRPGGAVVSRAMRRWQGTGARHGAAVGSAKLDDERARAIFLAAGSYRAIGRDFGVSHTVVWYIKREIWWCAATAGLPGSSATVRAGAGGDVRCACGAGRE